jgi:hypothetical protein
VANSRRWKALQREIEILREQFLPDPFDPLGNYPSSIRVQAYTRAFLVLSHAEVESYLEGWAKEIARAAEVAWSKSARVSSPLAYLLGTLAERVALPRTLVGASPKDSPQLFGETTVKLFQKYYLRIKNNHGIKERNLLDLYAPLGVPAAVLSPTLIPNLELLGSLRGTHAHNSAKVVQSILDPETEYKRVTDLADDLMSMDEWLIKYKRAIR